MTKITLNDVSNPQNEQTFIAQLNSNFDAIETFSDSVLSRNGTAPNSMQADLDMNSKRILNLPAPGSNTEPLRKGDLPDALPTILVQDSEPATTYTEGSLWIDSDSTDQDLYQLISDVWVDTGVNVRGDTGSTGAQGPQGNSPEVFVQNDEPPTTGTESSLWIDADSPDLDLYQLQSSVWVDTGVNLKGATGATGATGDPWNQWKGSWQTATGYVVNDAVTHNGSSYIATADHTSGSSTEPGVGGSWETVWDLIAAKGTDGTGAGNVNTGTPPVTSNNLVKYTGTDGNTIDDSGIAVGNVATATSNIGDGALVVGDGGSKGIKAHASGAPGDAAFKNTGTTAGTVAAGDHDHSGVYEPVDADILRANVADVLTAGFATTTYNAGTISSGTYTLDESNGNFQRAINGGAHTLAPPSNDCNIVVQYTNNASAGIITTSGWTKVTGDSLTTTNGHDFLLYCTKINTFSHLNIVALQ